MSEWNRSSGAWVPHEEASTREHFKEVGEDVRHEREGDRVAKAHRRRRWWKVWAKRSD